jgi:hypothetical protein
MIALRAAARHGRALLVGGLVAGLALPELALTMRGTIPTLAAALLFLAALRIGPRAAVGALRDLPATLALVAGYQMVLPLAVLAVLWATGTAATPLGTALVLVAAGPSISGSPSLAIMAGQNPAAALRLLVAGTAALPLTILPVAWALPALGTGAEVVATAARLLAVIALAGALGFALHARLGARLTPSRIASVDGLAAILMAVIVVGLMSAVGPALRAAPAVLGLWLVVAFAVNLGLQFAALRLLPRSPDRPALAIVAGNRNLALFLVALPEPVTGPLMLFIGAYQIPMYLTPLIMARAYRTSTTTEGPA